MYLKVVLGAGQDDQWLRLPDALEEDIDLILFLNLNLYRGHKLFIIVLYS